MTAEVYTGARPARPHLALLVCAGLLAAVLGLAGWQSHQARALAPAQQVGDLPFRVRPPAGWERDPQDPHAFVLAIHDDSWRRRDLRYERRLSFDYRRLGSFTSVEQILQLQQLTDPATLRTLQPARIGRFDAVQVHRFEPLRVRHTNFVRESIVRFTCLPRGELITITYDPLIELRPADSGILDDVCATFELLDHDPNVTPKSTLTAAALDFPLDPAWQVVGPDFPEIAGLYVGGSIDGVPAWSVGVFRSWLVGDRSAADLLSDFAAEHWLDTAAADRIQNVTSPAGAHVYHVRHPEFGRTPSALSCVWAVEQSATEVALLFVRAAATDALQADAVAEQIARSLRFTGSATLPPLDDATAAGVALVSKLHQRGAAPAWGSATAQFTYDGRAGIVPVRLLTDREARGRNAQEGYRGSERVVLPRGRERTEWTLDEHAIVYEWQRGFFHGTTEVVVDETRAAPNAPVERRVAAGREPIQLTTFTPDTSFVPPPAESVVEAWVADGKPPFAMVSYSVPLGKGSCSVLLRRLEPYAGSARVLLQQDYLPSGALLGYDAHSDELVSLERPEVSLTRVGN